jgi:hypothetical protein
MTDLASKSQNIVKYIYQNANGIILFTFSNYILAHILISVNPFDAIILFVYVFLVYKTIICLQANSAPARMMFELNNNLGRITFFSNTSDFIYIFRLYFY